MFMKSGLLGVYLAAFSLAAPTLAQERVYPVNKQSPEQQKQDEARCLTWATQQSGFDPAKPWFAPEALPPSSTTGSSLRFRSSAGVATGPRRDSGDAAIAGAIIAASAVPAGGATNNVTTRRETAAAVSGADGSASRPPATGAAVVGATGVASASPAGSAAAGAILGYDAASVTAGSAVAGATVRHDANPKITLLQEQAVSQQQLAGQASFEKARSACLEARGYATQ